MCVLVFLFSLPVTNLTAGTLYEVAVWAQTADGDSPTALSRLQTEGSQPAQPLLKARALNQTAVDCSWTGPHAQVHPQHTHTYIHTVPGHNQGCVS